MRLRAMVFCDGEDCDSEADTTMHVDVTGSRPHVEEIEIPVRWVLEGGKLLCPICAPTKVGG